MVAGIGDGSYPEVPVTDVFVEGTVSLSESFLGVMKCNNAPS